MPREDGKVFVNVLMDPEDLHDLEDVQAFYNIRNRSDAIRMLVRSEVRRLNRESPLFVTAGSHRDNLS